MESNSTQTRVLAIAAGVVFLTGTVAVLFEDVVLKGASFTLKHGLTAVVLAGTVLSGHLASAASAQRHRLAAFGFALVFIAGTALVVYGSVGRQADASIQTAAQIEQTNEKRADVKRTRAKAQTMLDDAQARLAVECRSGDGKACKGIRATIDVYRAAIKGHDADLERLGAPKTVAPEADQLAEISAAVFGADKARVKAAAVLFIPFLQTAFLEFGALVCFGFGFSRNRRRALKAEPDPTAEKVRAKTEGPMHPVLQVLHLAGRPVNVTELATLMECSIGEASKRKSEVAGLIRQERHGKEVRVWLN